MLVDYEKVQPIAFQIMKNAIKKNRISHAYLIETNGYFLKKELVFSFAKYLICPFHHLDYIESCPICHHKDPSNLLDLKWICADGMWIKKEQLETVQKEFNKKAIDGNKKVYVIENAEKLNVSSSNSLLKFLEEPEENIIAILMVDNIYQLLPTIVSRCQIIHLKHGEKKGISSMDIAPDFIENVYRFMSYLETNKKDTLLYENKLWLSLFVNKEDVGQALDILILFYKDIFNILAEKNVENFLSYQKELEKMTHFQSIQTVCEKINILCEKKEQLKINVNLNLLLDDLIIKFSEV